MVTREFRRNIQELWTSRNPINLSVLGPHCKLFVLTVNQANGLAKKDIFGLSDPYVRVRVVGPEDEISHIPLTSNTTPTIQRSLNPRWKHTFYFLMIQQQFTVILDVFDQNTLTRDDHLGRALLHFDLRGSTADSLGTSHKLKSLKQKYGQGLLDELREVSHMPYIWSLLEECERKRVTHHDRYKGVSGYLSLSYTFLNPHADNAVAIMRDINIQVEGIIPVTERLATSSENVPTEPAEEESSSAEGGQQSSAVTPALFRLVSEGQASLAEESDSDEDEEPLPEGWEERVDSNGRHFYRNHLTRTISMRRPGQMRPPESGRSYLPRVDSVDIMERQDEESEEDQEERPPDLASGHTLEPLQGSSTTSLEVTPIPSPSSPTTPSPTTPSDTNQQEGEPVLVQATPTSVTPSAPTLEVASPSALQTPPAAAGGTAVAPANQLLSQLNLTDDHSTAAPSPAAATTASTAAASLATPQAAPSPALTPKQMKLKKLRLGLPAGWDVALTHDGTTYYVDHFNKKTTWDRPRVQERKLVTAEKTISSAAVTQDMDLPEGWEKRITKDGKPYYIDHNSKTTQWEHPNAPKTSKESLGPLPHGWEMKQMSDGRIFFLDHTTKSTQWEDPRLQAKNKPTAKMEYSRDYKLKYANFTSKLKPRHPVPNMFRIQIRRDNVLEDSYQGIMNVKDVELLKSRIWIEFEGEKGYDYGGLSREWFYLLSHEVFNPYYGLFEYSASDDYTLQINPDSGIYNSNHLSYFRFTGRVCALAVYHKRLIDAFFIRPFYKLMLRRKVTLQDMQSVDVELHNSVQYILENDPEPLCLTFAVNKTVFGQVLEEEIIPNGCNIPVTEENKKEYIDHLIEWRFTKRVASQMDAFLKGFNDIIPLQLISVFDERELEYLLGGLAEIDINDWKKNTEYYGYFAYDVIIGWFWKAVETYDNEMRARLLQFVTGTSKVPMNGFAELQGSSGPRKFCIKRFGQPTSLPRAHTCFNRLDLPPYISYHQLRENLRLAVENTEGFEGVD